MSKRLTSLLLVFVIVLTLFALSRPAITVQPKNASAAAGSTATFTIQATGAASYRWQYRKTPDGEWANSPAAGNDTSALTVAVAAGKNGYQYRCVVTGRFGAVCSSAATLTVK